MGRKFIKKGCSLLVVMTVFLSIFTPILAEETKVYTGETSTEYAEPPYRAQLDSDASIFYGALETLYNSGDMKSGVGSYDLSTSFSVDKLENYAQGNSSLAKAFQSARDAFVMDYPNIFYVDFSKVTLRLGMKEGKYVLYINNGSNENYYSSSFSSQADVEAAISLVNEKKNQMKALISDTTMENPASIISAFHNALINHAKYTYPSKDNRDVSNIYGTLVNGTANCDGYSRTLKWLLDDYNITNVLVAGVGKNARYEENGKEDVKNTMNEYHQWNYVKLDGKWYGVDVTWDDPIESTKAADTIRTTYLLRGSDMLNENHFPLGQLSDGGQTFKYPKLEKLDYGALEKDENLDLGDISTDLKVYISKVEFPGQFDDVGDISKGTRYIVNYKNMTYEQLAEQGIYVAVRFGLSKTDFGPWEHLDAFASDNHIDPKNLFDATVFTKTTIQFCLTKVELPKGDLDYGKLDLAQEGNHVILTEMIDAPYYQNYTPPPFIRTSYPALTETILPEKKHYTVEYYEELEIVDNTKDVTIKINNTVGHVDAKVENITIKEGEYDPIVGDTKIKSTIVEFDFTPDSSFQGYANVYSLEIKNMQGVKSKKTPNQISIITTYEAKLPCPMIASAGGPNSAFVMSNPKLVIDEDMSETMFQDSNGNTLKYGNLNIALVATRTTGSEKENLDNALGDIMTKASASSTFELSLGCGSVAAALKPGYQVSVGVPYPEGFHPEDYKDVEFRAYHFKDVDGEWVSEEIICQITPQGLMIIANSFSPFTIVAFEKGKAPESNLQVKTVNVNMENTGGKITSDNGGIGTYAIEENQSRTFTVIPDEGYVIDKIIINNKEVKVSDKNKYTATFESEKMEDSNEMKVFFVAKKVIEEEKGKDIEAITPVLLPDEGTNNQPIYVERTLQATTSEGVAIKMSGIMLQNASIGLTMNPISKEAADSFASYNANLQTIVSGAPKLTNTSVFQGDEVHYEIPVNTSSKTLTFLTYDASKKTYVKTEAQVNNGIASVTVAGFEEFALLDKVTSVVVDKTALQSAYDAAILLVETDYTSSSWVTFEEKLEAAKVVLNNVAANQSEVDNAKLALNNAITALVERGDKTDLQSAYDAALLLVKTDYTSSSWVTFEEKLEAAKVVLNNVDAIQVDVNNALTALNEAQTDLMLRGDKEALYALIETAQAVQESGVYTSASIQSLEAALTLANTIINDIDATEASIIEAYNALEIAIQELVELGDKTVLSELLKQVSALDLSNYTDTSAKVLIDSIKEAQKVLDDKEATQQQIEVSIKAVQSAIDALEEKLAGRSENTTNDGIDTGDTTNIMLWGTLLVGSACLLLIGLRKVLKNK